MGILASGWLDTAPDHLLVVSDPVPQPTDPLGWIPETYELKADSPPPARGAQKRPFAREAPRPTWTGPALTVMDEPLAYFDFQGAWHDLANGFEAGGAPLPPSQAAPCPKCGCPMFWEDVYRGLHCCDCEPIPSRRLASGEAWAVEWSPDGAYWVDWTPQHWNPFAHLEAAEAAALAVRPAEDF